MAGIADSKPSRKEMIKPEEEIIQIEKSDKSKKSLALLYKLEEIWRQK